MVSQVKLAILVAVLCYIALSPVMADPDSGCHKRECWKYCGPKGFFGRPWCYTKGKNGRRVSCGLEITTGESFMRRCEVLTECESSCGVL